MSKIPIVTTDNSTEEIIDEQDREFLAKYSGKSISELQKEHPGLIVFGPSNFTDKGQEASEAKGSQHIWDCINDKLQTRNIVGIIGNGKTTVSIHSRFDKSDKQFDKSDKQYFLRYMLAKVFMPTLLKSKLQHEKSGELDLLPYLLVPYYMLAYRQYGLYQEYQNIACNDSKPQGRIDIARHINVNTPFVGTICYSKRAREYNNPLTRLLAHTLLYVEKKYFNGHLNWEETSDNFPTQAERREAFSQLKLHVPPANLQRSMQVLRATEKPIRSPYASKYEELRRLCRAILQQKEVGLQGNSGQVHGILFDVAWLWEEYLATLLPKEFIHTRARISGGIKIYKDKGGKIFPDFYSKNKKIVLDAKYKTLDSNEINRDDLYQMLSYMYILQAEHAILLYPQQGDKIEEFCGNINGYGGKLQTLGLPIPQDVQDFSKYIEKMAEAEKQYIAKMKIE